jgi:hypothetical protein
MPRIYLRDDERETLRASSRSSFGEQRMIKRSRVVLPAIEGLPAGEIAGGLKARRARVSKWRHRFCENRLPGLGDARP